jgi:hypothetical protein
VIKQYIDSTDFLGEPDGEAAQVDRLSIAAVPHEIVTVRAAWDQEQPQGD